MLTSLFEVLSTSLLLVLFVWECSVKIHDPLVSLYARTPQRTDQAIQKNRQEVSFDLRFFLIFIFSRAFNFTDLRLIIEQIYLYGAVDESQLQVESAKVYFRLHFLNSFQCLDQRDFSRFLHSTQSRNNVCRILQSDFRGRWWQQSWPSLRLRWDYRKGDGQEFSLDWSGSTTSVKQRTSRHRNGLKWNNNNDVS